MVVPLGACSHSMCRRGLRKVTFLILAFPDQGGPLFNGASENEGERYVALGFMVKSSGMKCREYGLFCATSIGDKVSGGGKLRVFQLVAGC